MDIEKLIDRLRKARADGSWNTLADFAHKAAEALSTLQAENEKLKDQLYDGEGVNLVNYWIQQAKIEENGHRNCQAENEQLRVELEQVKREWDAAIRDLRYLGDCVTCKYNKAPCPREDIGHKTCFQWRGQKED